MKNLMLISLIAASLTTGQVFAENSLELEPSINGEVSASGLYASQAEEDEAFAELSEPCIYGSEATVFQYQAKTQRNVERQRRLSKTVEEQTDDVAGVK